MSCGNVKNPPGFALCRVAKSKTRRVSCHVVWQSPKPAGFRAMSCGKVQNPPGFALCRVTKSKTRRVSGYVVCGNMKPAKFCMYPCRAQKHTPRNVLRQWFGSKIEQVLGVSLLGRVKSGGFFGGYVCGNMKPAKFCAYLCWGVLHTPKKNIAEGLGLKPGAFWVYPYWDGSNRVGFGRTRVGAYCIRPEMSCDRNLGLKSGRFWAYPYWEG